MRAVIQKAVLRPDARTVVISDVHGQLDYLRGLLDKVALSQRDQLIFCGDLVEKGPESLATLRCVMALAKQYDVRTVCGNCDGWHRQMDCPTPESDAYVRRYIRCPGPDGSWAPGLLAQMCAEIGFPLTEDLNMDALRAAVREAFVPELDFLRALPHVLETERFYFVHGGLPQGAPESWNAWDCMKNDDYLRHARVMDRWQIVGHTPVVLYREDVTCAEPLVDREKRVVSIDGGCVLKDDGQLNALIIPAGGGDFTWERYDRFPVRRVCSDQKGSERSFYIRWGDNRVRVLSRGEEFSRCRHLRTGYEMDVLTANLQGEGEETACNDCTDYLVPLHSGDRVSVVRETSRGWQIKKDGVSGWYRGALENE